MENQKSPSASSELNTAAKPVNQTTPTSPAPNAAGNTSSKSSGLVGPAGPPPAQLPEPFRDECIVLILSPKNTVHPVVHPTNNNSVRIFENAESAASEVLGSKTLSKYRFAVLPLKGLF